MIFRFLLSSRFDYLTFFALVIPGRASGDLYEDDGDGFGFQTGEYLLTHYEAERAQDGEVIVRVASSEGKRARPKRTLHVRLLIGEIVQVLFNDCSGCSVPDIVIPAIVMFVL